MKKIVKKLYKFYSFIFTKEEYDRLISKVLLNINEDSNTNIELILTEYLNVYISNYLNECLKEPNKFINIIFNFININMSLKSTNSECLNEVRKLTNLLKDVNFNSDYDIFIELILNSEILRNLLRVVVDNSKNLILSSRIDDLLEDEILISLIEAYCLLNNIDKDDNYAKYGSKLINTSYKLYLKDIKSLEINYGDEELLKRIEKHDLKARNILIEKYLNLVINIATKYINSGIDIEELVEEGNIGLITALDKFKISKGVKFSTYAALIIRQSIQNFIYFKSRSLRVPYIMREKYYRFNVIYKTLYDIYNANPSLEEIALIMDLSIDEVRKLYFLKNNLISLEDLSDTGGLTKDKSIIEDSMVDFVEQKLLQNYMYNILNKNYLTKNEIQVILLRYGFYDGKFKTLECVSKILKVSTQRVKQLEEKALEKIRSSRLLDDFSIYTYYPDNSLRNLNEFRKIIFEKKTNQNRMSLKRAKKN